ncbi:DUF3240 family protein [Noviherbaspirillum sp. 1P10PC]|uniref:DUF3240 family protein n=1 Tax=Noviherbaspirillum sp. 1P10PC TaxID=3132292 RepID=UPI0039A267FB
MTAMRDCLLTLVVPASIEDALLEHLAAHPEWADSLMVAHQDGMGQGANLVTAMEKVRGRARLALVTMPMQAQQVDALLASVRHQFPTPALSWWTVPLTAYGRSG